jgi:hypothetical protein
MLPGDTIVEMNTGASAAMPDHQPGKAISGWS